MVKRTLYFGNPVYLSLANNSLQIVYPETGEEKNATIEDIGFVILDHNRITLHNPYLTDKQFSMSKVFFSGKKEKTKAPTQQLELF